jgi:hypothetical protein
VTFELNAVTQSGTFCSGSGGHAARAAGEQHVASATNASQARRATAKRGNIRMENLIGERAARGDLAWRTLGSL